MIEEPLGGRGAGRAVSGAAALTGATGGVLADCGAGCGAVVAPGDAGVAGCGVLEFGLLNIVAGLYESQGVLGTAVHPHLVVQVRAG